MADSLFLSLWFPNFEVEDMPARIANVLRQFPFSAARPGITYVSVQPLSLSEPTIFEQRLVPPATPEEVVDAVTEFFHDDYAVSFEVYWNLWSLAQDAATGTAWTDRPSKVSITALGKQFEESAYTEDGHIMIDFGLDTPFLHEELDLDDDTANKVKVNIARLVDFTQRLENNVTLSGRVLWSESDENLAQKLIARLQQIQ